MPNAPFPTTDDAFDAWFHNFTMKFGLHATTLGYASEFVTALASEYEWFHWSLMMQELFETEASERVALKRLLRDGPVGSPTPTVPTVPNPAVPEGDMAPPGIVPRLRKLVQSIKNNPACTQAILEDLGIGTSTPTEDPNPKPSGTATALLNSQVQVVFKKGTHEAVRIEGQRGDESGYALLANVLHSPWIDTRPPLVAGTPEIRKYRMCYCDGDAMVGDYSDVLTAVTRP